MGTFSAGIWPSCPLKGWKILCISSVGFPLMHYRMRRRHVEGPCLGLSTFSPHLPPPWLWPYGYPSLLSSPDVLQRQHPDADSDAGDRGSHTRAGGSAGWGERAERRLQHTANAGQQRQVSRRPASPLWRAICWLGGKWMLKPRWHVLALPGSTHLAASTPRGL